MSSLFDKTNVIDAPDATFGDLDARSREIFRRIVESYLETGEPVGSRFVSKHLPHSLSPASVRNVMSDLEELGLVYAPHTSAGRMPTEFGLRFFVDAFLEFGNLTEAEQRDIEAQVAAGKTRSEGLLTEASQLLSGLSHGAGVVLTTKANKRLRHIEFVQLEPGKALVVIVGDDGDVENRIIDLPKGLPSSALVEAGNYLNAHIRGRTLSDAKSEVARTRAEQATLLNKLTSKVVDAGLATWAGVEDGRPKTLIVRGRSNLLDNVNAMEDIERIRQLFDELERKNDIVQLLGLAEDADGVRIFIGSENKLFSLSGSSLILSPYRDEGQNVVGVLGVIGPTRLNYARVVPVVDYTARLLSRLLT
jgi:heat-inducible transcriptional repressor